MKKSKIGWSLVLTISIAALIGYGAWGLQFVKRNEAFAINSNNQGMMNFPFNRERGGKDQNHQNFGGMMNGYNGNNSGRNNFGGMMGGSGFQNGDTNISSLDEETANKHMEDSLKNATVDKENNTISFAGKDITIVLLAGPEIADGKFVIGGLINPSLQVPKDAKISLEMINEDEGMSHGVEITNAIPPYNYMAMMGGGIYPDTFITPLPAATEGKYPTAVTTFNSIQEGDFYYICQYPSHASNGMYGKFIIK
jgi:rusticyanin